MKKIKNFIVLVFALLFISSLLAQRMVAPEKVVIDDNFPGGNIVVDTIIGDSAFIHQDLFDTERNWFYWYFRVKAMPGKKLTFHFTHPWQGISPINVIGVKGPAVSLDSGRTWSWMGTEVVNKTSFSFTFSWNVSEVRFSMGMPYVESDLQAFLDHYKANKYIEKATLATTREGRKVERLHLGSIQGDPKYRIVLTARHHACEMMTNYLLEGFMETVLAHEEIGEWFRKHVEVLIIPFVDKDGVEQGEQGKYRRARDHNRDYSEESIYESTRAIRSYVPAWSNGKLVAAIDLHCPYIRGRVHEQIHLVGHAGKSNEVDELQFSKILEKLSEDTTALPYKVSNNIPYGTLWNTDANNSKGKNFSGWVSEIEGVKLATTLEFPYAVASGKVVDQKTASGYGRTLAKAIQEYLLQLKK